MIVEVSDETPQIWKDLVVGLALLSKGATASYPTHCEHDELTVSANPHGFTRDELVKLNELGFFVSGHNGFKDDGTDDDDEDDEGSVADCHEEWCDAYFMSFRFGSA
jgi:hypothetical protein